MKIEYSKNWIRIEHETFDIDCFNTIVKILEEYNVDLETSKILLQIYVILLQNNNENINVCYLE